MKLLSFSTISVVLCLIYFSNVLWTLYNLWNPKLCVRENESSCIYSHNHKFPLEKWKMKMYSQEKTTPFNPNKATLIKSWNQFNFSLPFNEDLEILLPKTTCQNGTLNYFILLYPKGESAFTSKNSIIKMIPATKYIIPIKYFNLLDASGNNSKSPTTHWFPKISFSVLDPPLNFPKSDFPAEIIQLLKFDSLGNYLPIFYTDELSMRETHLKELQDSNTINITLSYKPISIGKLRLFLILKQSLEMLKDMGFKDKDVDEIKAIFSETNLYFLGLTFFVSIFHMLFDFLAFKNDISHWKKRDTMKGISVNTVLYRCISSIIIFLFLFDERTSYLILVPSGIGTLIEVWKVKKALKVSFIRNGWTFKVQLFPSNKEEEDTNSYDSEAFKYLSYAMYPLSIASAIYSLIYVAHKSIYSWIIQSLVNGM